MSLLVTLGPISLPTLKGDVSETVGDQLETVGAGVVPGERRPRTLPLTFPVHADRAAANRWASGMRMRRQVRALMENPPARLQGLYLNWSADPEQNCWLLVGGGDLKFSTGGIVFADFELALTDCYRVANVRTHRPARRIVRLDRRLGTVARDYLGTLFSTDFGGVAATARHYLGVAPTDVRTGSTGAPPTVATLTTRDGNLAYVDALTDGEIIDFEQAEGDMLRAQVTAAETGSVVNEITNPGAEENTTGWGTANSFRNATGATVTRVTAQHRTGNAAFQIVTTAVATQGMDYTTLVVVAGVPKTAWCYVKGNAGGEVVRMILGDATVGAASSSNLTLTTSWQLMSVTLTPSASGTTGVSIVGNAATVKTFFVDDIGAGPTVVDASGDTVGYTWAGAANASPTAELIPAYGPDQPLTGTPLLENAICRVIPDLTAGTLDVQTWTTTGWISNATVAHPSGATGFAARIIEWTQERAVLRVTSLLAAGVRGELYITLQRGWTGPRFELYGRNAAGNATVSLNVYSKSTGDSTRTRSDAGPSAIVSGTSIGTFAGIEPWVALIGPGTDLGIALTVLQSAVNLRGAILSSREGLAFESSTPYVSVAMAIGPRASAATDADVFGGQHLTDCQQIPELVSRA